jgi:hypothetical protein
MMDNCEHNGDNGECTVMPSSYLVVVNIVGILF